MTSLLAFVFALLVTNPAHALDLGVKVETGVAIPLNSPQSDVFDVGGGQTVKLLFGLTPWLDIGPTASFQFLPPAKGNEVFGTVLGLGAGLRLKRPHNALSYHGLSPWLDADALYVRTGVLNRVGLAAAAGLAVPLGETRTFWVGPFVRYLNVIQPAREGYDNSNAQLLTVGLSLEVGNGLERQPAEAIPPEIRTVDREVAICADRDNDGVPDGSDRCPDVAGPMDNWGCPKYEKLVVKPDKLELKEKLYFAFDQATLEEASFPVMDEVVKALKDNKGLQVQVDGHTDSTGTNEHNQTLSEQRAAAVVNYLVQHGIDRSRLVAKGFSSSEPIDTNVTVAGRENNRRVEFVVNFVILNGGAVKP